MGEDQPISQKAAVPQGGPSSPAGPAITTYPEASPVEVSDVREIPCPICGEKILPIAKKCRYCGEWLSSPTTTLRNPTVDSRATEVPKRSIASRLGIATLILGIFLLVGTLSMDTSVPVDDGSTGRRVHNIGLLNEKQNRLMMGGIVTLVGIGLMVVGKLAAHN